MENDMRKMNSVLAAALFCAAAIPILAAQAQDATQARVTVADAVVFTPLDPKNPGGIQVAVVSGDMTAKAPVTFLAKIPRGPLVLHTHTSDYYAVVVSGQYKDYPAGGEGTAQVMGPGSTWFQPRGAGPR